MPTSGAQSEKSLVDLLHVISSPQVKRRFVGPRVGSTPGFLTGLITEQIPFTPSGCQGSVGIDAFTVSRSSGLALPSGSSSTRRDAINRQHQLPRTAVLPSKRAMPSHQQRDVEHGGATPKGVLLTRSCAVNLTTRHP